MSLIYNENKNLIIKTNYDEDNDENSDEYTLYDTRFNSKNKIIQGASGVGEFNNNNNKPVSTMLQQDIIKQKTTKNKISKISLFDCITTRIARILFLIIICLTLILSFFLFIPLSQIYVNYNNQCPFGSSIYVRFVVNTPQYQATTSSTTTTTTILNTTSIHSSSATTTFTSKIVIDIDSFKSQWTKTLLCEYSFSMGILILCYCVITLFFFSMFNVHDIINNDDCLILPWLIVNIFLTICLFISNCLLTNGYNQFCYYLIHNNLADTNYYLKRQCANAQLFEWKKLNTNSFGYSQFVSCLISSWLLLLLFIINIFLLFMRLKLNNILNKRKLLVNVATVLKNMNLEQVVNKTATKTPIDNDTQPQLKNINNNSSQEFQLNVLKNDLVVNSTKNLDSNLNESQF